MSTPQQPPRGGKPDELVDAVDAALSRNRPGGPDPDSGRGLDPVLREMSDLTRPGGPARPGAPRRRSLWWIAAAVVVLGLAAGILVYLTRAAYVIEVRSAPEGAEIQLDGEVMGRAPVTLTLRTPPSRIRLASEGYETMEVPLSFDADGLARVDVRLNRLVRVESDPPGARILVDEIDTGLVTPAAVPIKEPYPTKVELRLDGYTAAILPVTIEVIREGRWELALEKAEPESDGRMVVTVSGSYSFGVTGCGAASAEAESHTLTVRPPCTLRLQAPAVLLDAARPIEPSSERSMGIAAPPLVSVQLRSRHEDCALILNGRPFGTPPVDVMVAEGQYSATLQCPDGRKFQTKMFPIAAGQSVRRVDDFLP
jgi:hypothetical protein